MLQEQPKKMAKRQKKEKKRKEITQNAAGKVGKTIGSMKLSHGKE